MTVFVKHFNLHLPTCSEVSEFPVLFPFTAKPMVYDIKLFTLEHKKMRIRHKFLYVKL